MDLFTQLHFLPSLPQQAWYHNHWALHNHKILEAYLINMAAATTQAKAESRYQIGHKIAKVSQECIQVGLKTLKWRLIHSHKQVEGTSRLVFAHSILQQVQMLCGRARVKNMK
jgi:hypothetical protein